MTIADWFRPRIDGTLQWQQALALMVVLGIVIGPVHLWLRYDVGPTSTAKEAVAYAFGPDSDFRATRIVNHLWDRSDLFPERTTADVLVCGTATVEGRRVPVGMLAETRRRGSLHDIALFLPDRTDSALYPAAGPTIMALCEDAATNGWSPSPLIREIMGRS